MNKKELVRNVIAAAAGFSAAALVDSEIERRSIRICRYRIETDKLTDGEKRFVFLSDIHGRRFGENDELLLKEIRLLAPDAVLVGGDTVTAGHILTRPELLTQGIELFRRLGNEWPVYAGDGNHEPRLRHLGVGKETDLYTVFKSELKKAGVQYLTNASADLGGGVRISGITFPEICYAKGRAKLPTEAYLHKKLGQADASLYNILLAHTPSARQAAAEWGADLMLAGHYHGGTIRLPGGFGLMTPQYSFLRRDTRGLHTDGTHAMIVSPGLGTHTVNLRINNPPQIVFVRLVPRFTAQGDSGIIA